MEDAETIVESQRNVDVELLEIVGKYEEELRTHETPPDARVQIEDVINLQQKSLKVIAESMPQISVPRRLLRLLFPLVDESRRVRS